MVVEWRAHKCCIWICFLCLALRVINCEFDRSVRQWDCIQYCRRSDCKRYRKWIFHTRKSSWFYFQAAVEQHWKWSITRHHWIIIMIHMSFFLLNFDTTKRFHDAMRWHCIAGCDFPYYMRFASQRLNESRASIIRNGSFFREREIPEATKIILRESPPMPGHIREQEIIVYEWKMNAFGECSKSFLDRFN